jgi:hypothetical protein
VVSVARSDSSELSTAIVFENREMSVGRERSSYNPRLKTEKFLRARAIDKLIALNSVPSVIAQQRIVPVNLESRLQSHDEN